MDPLMSELVAGPLDGGYVNIRLGAGIFVIVEDDAGAKHFYQLDYTERARLVYSHTLKDEPKKLKARKLKGGL